jgi:hypothetical protein
MIITVELTEKEIESLKKFVVYKHLCGAYTPSADPVDALAQKVLLELATQEVTP